MFFFDYNKNVQSMTLNELIIELESRGYNNDAKATQQNLYTQIRKNQLFSETNRLNAGWARGKYVIASFDGSTHDLNEYLQQWVSKTMSYTDQTLCLEINRNEWKFYDHAGNEISYGIAFPTSTSYVFESLQQIFYGAPGTGKSHSIDNVVTEDNSIRTTFHPDSDYASFVGSYKPTMETVKVSSIVIDNVLITKPQGELPKTEKKIVYKFIPQAFLKAYIKAWSLYDPAKDNPFYLVIEEINRGNCAQIFGDLFQLLDRNNMGASSYSIYADDDIRHFIDEEDGGFKGLSEEQKKIISEFVLIKDTGKKENIGEAILNGTKLLLPPNMRIWATMNTSDQSLFPIDSAFKRRWDWKYIKIADAGKNWKINVCSESYDWWQFVQAINYFVFDATQSEDKNLGYFFAKAKDGVINAETFVSKVIFYLYTDVFKDYGFSGDIFKGRNGEEMTFQSFYNADGSVNEAQIKCFIENVIYSEALPEALKVAESVEEQANESNGKKKLVIKFPDGTVIKEATQFASYRKALEKIGLDKAEHVASSKRYSRLNCPLVSKTQYDAILDNTQGFSYVNVGDYYIIKGIIVGTMNDFLNQISTELDLGIISSIETSAE